MASMVKFHFMSRFRSPVKYLSISMSAQELEDHCHHMYYTSNVLRAGISQVTHQEVTEQYIRNHQPTTGSYIIEVTNGEDPAIVQHSRQGVW